MDKFKTKLITEDIDGKYNRLVKPFIFQSAILDFEINIPAGFITDFESIPLFRGSSKRAGVIHDYLCRIDAKPCVSKRMAARIYREAMANRDKNYPLSNSWFYRFKMFCIRWVKSTVVRFAWGYWHKFKVKDTYVEIKN